MKAEDGSYVNLAHAVRLKRMRSRAHPGKGEDPSWVWGIEMRDGELIETNEGYLLADWLAHIVPGQPGQELLAVSWDWAERPTELWITRLPIIGWRVDIQPDSAPTPITPDALTEDCRQFVVLPDGSLLEPYVGIFENAEAMKAALLESAQTEWDNAQAAKAAKAAKAAAT